MRTPKRLAVERLDVHPNRFRWPKRWARHLGRMPDKDLAARAGRSKDAVIEERRRRGIPAFRRQRAPIEWTAAMLRLLGTDTDVAVAAELGIRKQDVFRKRRILGIPSYAVGTFRPPGFHWSARALGLLGRDSDPNVARRLRVSRSTVALKRLELGIPSYGRRPEPVRWSAGMLALLGKVTDAEISRRYAMTKNTVMRKRSQLGIPSPLTPRAVARTPALSQILKRLPDQELRGEHGLSRTTVRILRRELGIVAPETPDPRWTRKWLARLGNELDRTLAGPMGIATWVVAYKRRSLGIPAYRPKHLWTAEERRLLGRYPDVEVARRVGVSLIAVQLQRRSLGIPRPPRATIRHR